MEVFLFVVIAANLGVFAGLAWWAIRAAQHETQENVRVLTWALASVCLAFVLGALTRALLVATRQGWLPGSVGDFLVGDWHLLQSLVSTLMGLIGIVFVRRYVVRLRAAERIAARVSDRLLGGGSLEQFQLTKREREVLTVISEGASSDAEIAARLFISPATAGTHVKNILRKTGTRSRRELAYLVDSSPTE